MLLRMKRKIKKRPNNLHVEQANSDSLKAKKFSGYSSSGSSSSGSPNSFRNSSSRLFLFQTTIIIIIALLVLLPSSSSSFFYSYYLNPNDFAAFASSSSISQSETTVPPPPPPPVSMSSQLSQSQKEEKATGPLADNFTLSAGYAIEPFLWNLSLPTSIAVDSGQDAIYIAEYVEQNDDVVVDNNNISNSSMAPSDSSSSSPLPLISFPSEKLEPREARILKAVISDVDYKNSILIDQTINSASVAGINDVDNSNTTIIYNDISRPVIDMEVDDANGLLYTFDGQTTISRINLTSGESKDILSSEEDKISAASNDKYQEEQHNPLSIHIHSPSQIALSGRIEVGYQHDPGDNDENSSSSSYLSNSSTTLYIPCKNDGADNAYDYPQNRYCILSLPIDTIGNYAIFDNISSMNNLSSFILQNMTSRPVGIAIVNSPYTEVCSSSTNITEPQNPYALTRNQTLNFFANNNNDNDNNTELLIITSQPTSGNSNFENTDDENNGNQVTSISYRNSNYSADDPAALSSRSTIYYANVPASTPDQGGSSKSPGDNSINSSTNNSKTSGKGSIYNLYNHQLHQQHLTPPSINTLADYPDGQLGKVVAVFVPPVTTSSSSPLPFGLNETTAFIIDSGNSSESAATATQLPKIMMLNVRTGSITPFLTLNQPDPNFAPIDIAFDYVNSALYVLSISNNKEEESTNNVYNNNNITDRQYPGTSNDNKSSGVIWKLTYQGEEGLAAINSNNSSSFSNSTGSNNNNTSADLTVPPPPPPPSSSNDTGSSDGSSDDSSSSTDDSSSSSSSSTDDNQGGTEDGNASDADSVPPPPPPSSEPSPSETTTPPAPPPSQPSTQPGNEAPIAEDDAAVTDQDTTVVIDVLANDRDDDDSDDSSLMIDSVDEETVQRGNVRIISGSGNDGDNDKSGEGVNTNARIEYTPTEGFFGNDEFTYRIVDRDGATDTARVTVTVNQIIFTPHPISYWLENGDGITQDLLEKAAEGHDNNNEDEWSFNLGNFRVPVEFDVSDSENDTKGILEAYHTTESGGG